MMCGARRYGSQEWLLESTTGACPTVLVELAAAAMADAASKGCPALTCAAVTDPTEAAAGGG